LGVILYIYTRVKKMQYFLSKLSLSYLYTHFVNIFLYKKAINILINEM
jgi:hypothetical protein